MRAAVASCELSLQKNAMPIFQLLRPEIYNKRLIWNSSSPSSLRIARGSCYSAFRLREDQSMPSHKSFALIFAVLLCASIFSLASDKKMLAHRRTAKIKAKDLCDGIDWSSLSRKAE